MSVEQIGFYQLPSDPKLRQKMMQTLENCRAAQIRIKTIETSAKYQDLYESLYPNAAPDRTAE